MDDDATLSSYERRAPGWVVRCLRCGFSEPWGKYGVRKFAAGRKFTLARCQRCKRLCCHAIEKRPSQSTTTNRSPGGVAELWAFSAAQ
ncbi:MAG: hypothetical protein KAR11_02405 [Phycisphaerae bacterium]|nr:hypothetical protein [Phycisphaerae bacterium]